MTHHPRPPLFGADINDGLGRVPTHAEQMALISRGLRETHWPPDVDRVRRWQRRLGECASEGMTVYTPGMNEPVIITDFGHPARVVSIVGPGIEP